MTYKIKSANAKGKKYTAILDKEHEGKSISFGASDYAQYKDRTSLGKYSNKDHGDVSRLISYYKRHYPQKAKGMNKNNWRNVRNRILKETGVSDGARYFSSKYLW